MATGYTHNVQDGSITEFRDFAWQCARAFGALIELRDEPSDAPIPKAFKVDTSYYDLRIEQAKRLLNEIHMLGPDDWAERAAAEHRAAVASWEKRRAERNEQKLRYLSMIEKVEKWAPPTPEHIGMKDFMLQQLRDSMKFDCSDGYDKPPEPETGTQWWKRQLNQANRDVDYNTEERAKEIERVEGRNTWLARLRESLEVS